MSNDVFGKKKIKKNEANKMSSENFGKVFCTVLPVGRQDVFRFQRTMPIGSHDDDFGQVFSIIMPTGCHMSLAKSFPQSCQHDVI